MKNLLANATRWAHGAAASLALLTACGNDDARLVPPLGGTDGSEAREAPPLYLAASWVTDAELINTYVAVFDSLDVERLDFSDAREIPGFGDAWVYADWVFVSDGESPKVGRYSLGDDGTLVPEVELDFSNYGVAGAAFWDQQILSPTKAYLSNVAGLEYVVWNPTSMEITGTVPLYLVQTRVFSAEVTTGMLIPTAILDGPLDYSRALEQPGGGVLYAEPGMGAFLVRWLRHLRQPYQGVLLRPRPAPGHLVRSHCHGHHRQGVSSRG